MATTVASLQGRLGSSVAEVVSSASATAGTASSLNSIETIALYSFVGALVAASTILLLSMLMIVRERRREIGILKAFGSSNGGVVGSFMTEALTLTAIGAAVGTLLGVLLSSPILKVLVNSTSSSNGDGGGRFGGFGGIGGGRGFGGNFGVRGSTVSQLHAVLGTNVAIFALTSSVVRAEDTGPYRKKESHVLAEN